MNKLSLDQTPSNLRILTALLLNFTILMTPIAAVAARTETSEIRGQSSEKVSSADKHKAAAKDVFANPPGPVFAASPIIAASMTDSIENDDGDGKIDPTDGTGATERIIYSTTITNSGTVDATGVQFTDTIDSHTTLVGGSLNVSPLASDDSYDTIGNTLLEVGPVGSPSAQPKVTVGTGGSPKSVFDNDTEFLGDTFTLSKLQATTYPGSGTVTAASTHGSVTMDGSGHFSYLPTAGYTGDDTFTYEIKDAGNLTGTGTVTIHVNAQKIWYVQNNSAGTNQGTSENPYTTLASAQASATTAGDIIYVFNGNNTTGNQNAGYTIQANNQRLIGEGVQLDAPVSVNGGPNPTVLRAAGSAAKIGNGAGDAVTVTNKSGVIIRGFIISDSANGIAVSFTAAGGSVTISNNSIAGGTGNAIDVTSSGVGGGSATISNNAITAAGAEGIDINANGSGTLNLTVDTNTIVSTGNGFDVQENAGACNVSFTNNTGINSGATGVSIVRVTGTLSVTAFSGNQISGNTVGNGVVFNNAIFDSNPATGATDALVAGTLTIGASGAGNGVGLSGLVLTNTTGTLPFTNLNIFTDAGRGIDANGSGSATAGLTVNSGNLNVTAVGGAACKLDGLNVDLQNAVLASTNSPDNGVAIGLGSSVTGTFSATNASSITNAAGDDFAVGAGTADIAWNASLNNSNGGNAVDVTGHSGGTVSFTGAITDSVQGINLQSNAGATISISGGMTLTTSTGVFVANGGGTVNVTGTNTIGTSGTPANGPALNITNTTIGASGVTFRSIYANGGTNGIVINNTGATAGFTIAGNGGSCTSTATCTGGAITNATGDAVKLTNTKSPSFTRLAIQNSSGSGVKGTTTTNFTFQDGFIDNSGTGLGADTSNIAFNTQAAGTENNLSGTVNISNNTLTTAYYHGVDLYSFAGTISSLTISGNTITSTTSTGTSKGTGIRVVSFGNASGAANVNNATISNNTISNFPSGAGITMQGGNATAGGAQGTLGIPGDASNKIDILNNTIKGNSSGNKMGTNAIQTSVNGVGRMNVNIDGNGTIANPITNIAGNVISLSVLGNSTGTAVINNNVIVANHQANFGGPIGISTGVGKTFGTSDVESLTLTITNNNVSQTDGNGIKVRGAEAQGTLNVTIKNNTVGQPKSTDVTTYGIRLESAGTVGSPLPDNDYCVDIQNNTVTGSTDGVDTAPGIGIRKQGTSTTANAFGVEGMAATSSPGVEQYIGNGVGGKNPGSGSGTAGGGGTNGVILVSATSGFTNCASAPLKFAEGGVTRSPFAFRLFNLHDDQRRGLYYAVASATNDLNATATTAASAPASSVSTSLTQSDLDNVVTAAIDRWIAAGLTPEQLASVRAMGFKVSDLSGAYLSEVQNNTILVDRSARGKGWFVDATPQDDAEFGNVSSGTRRYTTPAGAPAGHVDLLTAIEHEIGHKLGLGDFYDAQHRDDLMYGYLTVGERRSATQGEARVASTVAVFDKHYLLLADESPSSTPLEVGGKVLAAAAPAPGVISRATDWIASWASSIVSTVEPTAYAEEKAGVRSQDSEVRRNHTGGVRVARNSSAPATAAPFSGETVTFDMGLTNLPVGKSVTIVFKVTLNNLPGLSSLNPPRVSNQGRVFGTNFTLVNGVTTASPNTDDPAPPVLANGTHDATETLADLFNTTTAVQTSGSPSFQGDSVTFTATVSYNPTGSPSGTPGTPTGTVQFLDNATPITCNEGSTSTQTLNGSGVATCTTSTLSAAAHTINVNYNGDGNFDTSSGSVGQTVNPCTVNPIVTNTNDSGAGSLRDAISSACSANTIDFNIAGAGPHTITLTTGQLSITRNVTITNTSGKTIIISGGNTSRVFNVAQNLSSVNISNVTITNGNSNGGGGILVNDASTLTVNNVNVTNSTTSGGGGGIGTSCTTTAPNLVIKNSTISGNTASGDIGGGAVYGDCSNGTITIDNSTLDGNHSTANAAPTYGGGAISIQPGVLLYISNSTISNNDSVKSGGGLYTASSAPSQVHIVNTTISGNFTNGNGGGMNGRGSLVNVTITNNRADADNNATGTGGGIFVQGSSVALLSTIVSGNFAGSGSTADDIKGSGSATGSFNLIGTGGSGGLTNGVNNNQVGVADARLGALANNGGATMTHKLLFDSPAIEAGTDFTTLNGGIDNVTTSVTVTDASNIPTGVGFLIQIDSEQMSVTSKATNTLTVVRAANGTSAASHTNGAAVNPAFDQRGSAFPRKADSADANSTQTVDVGAYELHPTVEDIPDKSTAEDTPFNFNFNIGDGTTTPTLITSVTATSNNAALIPNANLSITGSGATRNLAITPVANANSAANGTATITVTVTATNSQTATDTFVVTVTDVNDTPNVTGETIGNIAEDCASGCTAGKYVIPFATLLANDNPGPADESGQTITITNVGSAVGGSVAINGTNVEFTPTADYNGAAGFQYTVTDNGTTNGSPDPKSAVGTASFTITEVNDPPVATDDVLAGVSEDCASGCSGGKYVIPFATLTGNDSKGPANESTQTLTITLVNNPVGGTVAINGTNVEFTPTANFNGTGSFDYTVQDNGTTNGVNDFKTAVGHVTFPVAPIADTPTATPNPASTNEDVQTSGIVIDRNAADGTEVAFFQVLNITNGSLFQNNGTTPITNNSFITYAQGNAGLKFTPSANFSGVSSFQVKGSIDGSGTGLSGALTVTINVGAVADVPTITPTTTNEDTQSSSGLVITKNAVDGSEVTHFKITNITNGTLFQNNGTTQINNGDFITVAQGGAGLKFTPSPNLYSPVSTFGFDAAGATSNVGAGLGNSATASITVNAVADTPNVNPNPQTTAISTQTGPMVINRNAADAAEVTHFKITNITNGVLYQNDGTTPINNNDFITFAQGNAGLKFTPTAGLSSPANNFGYDVQASLNNTNGGLGGGIVHEDIIVSCSDPQVVTSILDDGSAGTLRYAIANSCPGTGTITFNLPAGPQTIMLGSPLTITKTLAIIGPSNQAITINGNGNRVLSVTGGSPTISNLTFSGALVSGGNGGGLLNTGTGTITFNAVTFSGNSADNGGAIATTAGTIVLNNSTISGNTGTTNGGGIYVNGGTVTLLNDTITNNTATAGQGGGLNRVAGTVNVKNTIIAGNNAPANANVAGTINDQGNNILAGNPQLAALANNGGPTMTHALLSNSPALDAGDNTAAAALVTDQRGNTFGRFRDAANDADTTQTVDIGSFEADPSVEDISNKTTNEDTALPTFSFRVADTFSAFDSITATSSNQTLVPNANILISGSGNSRNMDITPAANQFGTSTITVTATKTINSTQVSMSDTFVLTVNTVPDTPSITNSQTDEDVQSTFGLVVTKNAVDGAEVNNFKITGVTGGTLFKNDGVTPLAVGSFITIAEGGAGLKFTPAANSITAGTVTVVASTDAIGTVLSPNSATATITIVPIADTPSVTNATTNEDTQSTSGLVVTRNAVDGPEVTHFKITNITNGRVFKNGGTVEVTNNGFITVAEGNAGLQFLPAANLNSPGSTFSFRVQAATNGAGVGLSSGFATATITVNPVNDAPSFTKGADQTVIENSGPQTVPNWATNLSPGPSDESGQTLTFQVVGNTNPALFSAAPAISSGGTLTYTPANNVAGTAQITVNVKDNGGTANGGSDTSGTQTFNITVTPAALLSFSAPSYAVNENIGSMTVTVNRAGDSSVAVTVDYATSDNSGAGSTPCTNGTGFASSRCDFDSQFGTLRFGVGETAKTFTVPITRDSFAEGPETFSVTLSNPTGAGAMLVVPSTSTVTINDVAPPPPPPVNAIDDTTLFVQQQYRDFLNREADPAGLAFWTDNIDKCNDPARRPAGLTVAQCIEIFRIQTSAAFFLSIEFQQSGGLVRDAYVASLDRPATNNTPNFVEFMRDTQTVQKGVIVGQPGWPTILSNNRTAFLNDFVMRAEFIGLYPTTDTPTQYVDKLYLHANVAPTNPGERAAAIAEFGSATNASDPGARGRALLRITQNPAFQNREFRRAFVQMQYFGYLRRNPNDLPDGNFNGYNFWVNKLNAFNGDFVAAEMVKAFLASSEYRGRFGP